MIKIVRGDLSETYNRYVTREKNPEMMDSEFGVIYLKKGESFELLTEEEYVFVLNRGEIEACGDYDTVYENSELLRRFAA